MTLGMGATFCAFGVLLWTVMNVYFGMFTVLMGTVMLLAGVRRLRAAANFPQMDNVGQDGKELTIKDERW